jgi:hypothetical protein
VVLVYWLYRVEKRTAALEARLSGPPDAAARTPVPPAMGADVLWVLGWLVLTGLVTNATSAGLAFLEGPRILESLQNATKSFDINDPKLDLSAALSGLMPQMWRNTVVNAIVPTAMLALGGFLFYRRLNKLPRPPNRSSPNP